MRKWANVVTVGAILLSSRALLADFQISAFRTDLGAPNSVTTNGNGAIPGFFGMVEFFAKNLGTNGTGSRLDTVSLTLADTGPGSLVIGGYSGTGTPSGSAVPDLYGQSAISSSAGSYIFKETNTGTTGAPKYVTFVNIMGDPTTSGENSPNNISPSVGPIGFSPSPTFSNYAYAIKSFSAVYGSTNSLPNTGVNATTANGGRGALFAVAVVPIGDSVNVQGQMGGDQGNGTNFNYTSSVVQGNADLSGTVNLNDYNAVVRNFGTGTTWTQGNFDQASTVDLNDYNTVVRNFGQSAPTISPAMGAAVAAPEPACLGMLGVAAVGLLMRRRAV